MNPMLMQLLMMMQGRGSAGQGIQESMGNNMSFPEMQRLRENPRFAQNQGMQDYLAPPEHQAFMRGVTGENPMMGSLLAGAAAPYEGAKAMAPGMVNRMAGGGGPAMQSNPQLLSLLMALKGYQQGTGNFNRQAAQAPNPFAQFQGQGMMMP